MIYCFAPFEVAPFVVGVSAVLLIAGVAIGWWVHE